MEKLINIVMVDDDDIIIECVARKLRGAQCTLTTYTKANEGLAYLKNASVQILLIDMRMPQMSGIDFLREIPEICADESTKIYLCSSALPHEDVINQAERLGAVVITKDLLMEKNWLLEVISA